MQVRCVHQQDEGLSKNGKTIPSQSPPKSSASSFMLSLRRSESGGSNLKQFIGEREILALSITLSNRFAPCRSRNQRQRSSKQRKHCEAGGGRRSEEEWERK